MIPSDVDLIARVLASDDRAAFGKLVLRHQSVVRQFLRHLNGNDAALADDLAQETFVQAYRSLFRFRGDAAFSTWLLGIAHNRWRNARRRQRDYEPLDESHTDDVASRSTETSDLQQDLTAALKQLGADEQLALYLSYHQGLSHGETAALLNWPLGTVKTHVARGKEKLRQILVAWNPLT